MTKTTYLASTNSTVYSASAVELTPANTPTVTVRSSSSQTSSLGVHVAGSMKLQGGKATPLSLSLDPVALERKLAVQQLQMELQGSPSALTTNRRR